MAAAAAKKAAAGKRKRRVRPASSSKPSPVVAAPAAPIVAVATEVLPDPGVPSNLPADDAPPGQGVGHSPAPLASTDDDGLGALFAPSCTQEQVDAQPLATQEGNDAAAGPGSSDEEEQQQGPEPAQELVQEQEVQVQDPQPEEQQQGPVPAQELVLAQVQVQVPQPEPDPVLELPEHHSVQPLEQAQEPPKAAHLPPVSYLCGFVFLLL